MKKCFLVIIILLDCLGVMAQKKLYLPDNSFQFKPAKFTMPLFSKNEIVGVFKDLFLIRTSIDNSLTLLLVDTEGNILENFEKNWSIPQNWQEENGFWLYKPAIAEHGPSIVNILKYNFTTKSREIKTIEVPTYYQYSEFMPVISGNYFLCLNIKKEVFLFEFTTEKLTKIKTQGLEIMSVGFDNQTNKVNIFEVVYSLSNSRLMFYQVPINDEFDFSKHLKWSKNIQDLKIQSFYTTGKSTIDFVSSTEFVVKYTKFEDTLCIAAKYDLAGKLVSTFRLTEPRNIKFITSNSLWNTNYQITYADSTWFLTNSGLASIIYQKNETEKSLFLENKDLVQVPHSLQATSSKYFVYSDSTNNLYTVNTKTLSTLSYAYKIPEVEKSYSLSKVNTLSDGGYWLYYRSPWGTYIKYNNKNEEVYRTPDSVYTFESNNNFFRLNDTDALIATYVLKSNEYCNNCFPTFDRYLQINDKNESYFLNPADFLNGKPIFYYDNFRQHFYTKTDSLSRYTSDAKIDTTFRIEKNISSGSMLVSKKGNIYLGQTFFYYNIDSVYKLNTSGRVMWRKKYISGESNPYAYQAPGTSYGGLYPLFNKDSVIIFGSLTCGEGCYTSTNVALTENEELVKLPYLEKLENYGAGYAFIDKYGVFMKNAKTFMVYDRQKNAIEKDTNTSIKFNINYEEINELDVLPTQDLLVIERNKLRKYSFRNTIWTTITNFEKEKEKPSTSFWHLDAADAKNKEIKLEVSTSDSSPAMLKIIPNGSEVAYIQNQTLFFTGKEGRISVSAQSVKGGEPYISPEFIIRRGNPPFAVNFGNGIIYSNRPVTLQFESVEGISFKIDTLQGSCKLQDDKIVATPPLPADCIVYFSWAGSDIYASGSSSIYLHALDALLLSNESLAEKSTLFPNPLINNTLTIKSNESISQINLINVQGQKIALLTNQSYQQGNYYFSGFEITSHLNSGTYIVEIVNIHGIVEKKEKLVLLR